MNRCFRICTYHSYIDSHNQALIKVLLPARIGNDFLRCSTKEAVGHTQNVTSFPQQGDIRRQQLLKAP